MVEYPTGYQVYHALVRLLEANGVPDAAAAVDVTLVPQGKSATYTVVPTERAQAALAQTLGRILRRPFRTDEQSWVLEAADIDPLRAASGS
jgi:hypothetical protein